jgi:hypothetical protein
MSPRGNRKESRLEESVEFDLKSIRGAFWVEFSEDDSLNLLLRQSGLVNRYRLMVRSLSSVFDSNSLLPIGPRSDMPVIRNV